MLRAKLYRSCSIMLLGAVLCFCLLPSVALADGGAPNLAYVANAQNGVGVIDISQQKMTSTITVPGNPDMVQLSLDGRFLYVAQASLGRVSIVGARAGNIICSANLPGRPSLLTQDLAANLLFVAGNGASQVTMLDPTNCTIKHVFQTSGPVYGLAVAGVGTSLSANSGNQLWVSLGDSLTVFDDIKGQQVATVPLPAGPRYLSIPPGTTVYATTQQGSVVAIDLSTHNVLPLISGGTYGPMDFDETTGEIYIPDQQHNQLMVLNPVNAGLSAPSEPERTISLGVRPESIAITSDGQLGFAALDGGNVAMLDIPGHQVLTTIKVGGNPRFIITGLYPPLIGTTPQQASIFGTLVSIAAYAIVVLLLVVPVIFFLRHSKAHRGSTTEPPEWSASDLEDEETLPGDAHEAGHGRKPGT